MAGGWDGIEEFVCVARAGSFTGGARLFNASVTHMSRAVARLEARLDAQLFNRTTRSVYLTDTGTAFLENCQRLIESRDEAINLVASQDEPSGLLRLTCSYALGEKFIAPLVRRFAQANPQLRVMLDLDNDVVDIAGRGYDLAVRTGHLEDSRLIATRVAQRELATVASRDYLSHRGRPRTIADLAGHDCLLGSTPQWHFREGQTYRPEGRWKCNSGAAVLEACLAGMGVCQLPVFYLGDHVAAGRLEVLLPDQRSEDEPIWAVYPARRHLSPKVSHLVALLRADLQPALDAAGV